MNRKLAITTVFLVLLGGLSIAGLKIAPDFYDFGEKLSEKLETINSFTIDNSMQVVRKNGVWSSQEDDFYPVDNDVVELFFKEMKKASLKAEICEGKPDAEPGMVLHGKKDIDVFYDENNEINTKIVLTDHKKCYVLTGDFRIPAQPYQWFVQPLLPFSNQNIEEIYGADPAQFAFSELFFYQAVHNNDFEDWDNKKIKIIMNNGIIAELTIYAQGHSYWMSVNLTTTALPSIEADEFVKNNGFLYEGWYFEIPQPEGSRLFNYGL